MTLDRRQQLELRLADGFATPDERAEAIRSGIDVGAAIAVREALAEALEPTRLGGPEAHAAAARALAAVGLDDGELRRTIRTALDAGDAPELADAVVEALGVDIAPPTPRQVAAAHDGAAGPVPGIAAAVLAQTHPGAVDVHGPLDAALAGSAGVAPELGDAIGGPWELGSVLRAALDGGHAPDLTRGVSAAVALEPVASGTGAALREAAGPAPDLGETVLAAIEGNLATIPVGEALAATAGEPPGMWEAIALEIGATGSAGTEPVPGPSALRPTAERSREAPRRWWLPAAGIAAAAAAAVFAVVGLPSERASDGQGALAGHIHLQSGHAEIEEISAGPDAMVQVLQFDEDAPTIIYIDVLEAPAGVDGDAGVSL